ncbi:transposase [Pseudolactococcus yaeyamensis]
MKQLLSEKETGKLYGKRKIDIEPAFAHLKANLDFTRFSVRGKDKVRQESGLDLIAISLRKLMVTCRI